jgi:hypothetical protein
MPSRHPGIETQRFAPVRFPIGTLSLLAQGEGQVAMGVGPNRFQPQRFLEMFDGSGQLPLAG